MLRSELPFLHICIIHYMQYWKIMLKECQSSKVRDFRIKDDSVLDLPACANTIWYSLCIHNQIIFLPTTPLSVNINFDTAIAELPFLLVYTLSLLLFHSHGTKQLMLLIFQTLLTSQISSNLCMAFSTASLWIAIRNWSLRLVPPFFKTAFAAVFHL